MSHRAETDLPPTDFVLGAVRVGVRMTQLSALVAAATPFLPGTSTLSAPTFLVIITSAVALSVVVGRVDWEGLLHRGRAHVALELWALCLVLVIAAAVGLAGRPEGEGHLFLFLVVVFFSLLTEGATFLRITLATMAASLGLAVAGGLGVAPIITRLGSLALLAHLAQLGRQLLAQRAGEAEEATRKADHRAAVLATVADSARAMSTLEPQSMLLRFVESAVGLGFQTGNVCLLADDETYEVVAPVGHDDPAYASGFHPADRGMVALVVEAQAPVVVEDYANHPRAVKQMQAKGYLSVVGLPIWTKGRLEACLIVGTRDRSDVQPEVVEALELLAALAGRALENATLFEAETARASEMARLAKLKSDFVSNVSHELRTPLTVIEGIGATLVERGAALDDDLRTSLLGRLNANAASLHGILGRLLDFSRLEAGTLELQMEETQLGALVEAVGTRVAPLLSRHHLEVVCEDRIPVRADHILVERVVENLLVNAAKHTPPGTTVGLRAVVRSGRARLEVRDDGPGIPAEELPLLTQRFFRGGDPDTRERKGLGLGLSLVHELLDLHGSELEVTSEVGVGSTFAFELPLSVDDVGLVGKWDRDLDPRLDPNATGA